MQKTQDMMNDSSQDAETNDVLKIWKTPELRILPVPSRTQGGRLGNKNDQDDQFYKKS